MIVDSEYGPAIDEKPLVEQAIGHMLARRDTHAAAGVALDAGELWQWAIELLISESIEQQIDHRPLVALLDIWRAERIDNGLSFDAPTIWRGAVQQLRRRCEIADVSDGEHVTGLRAAYRLRRDEFETSDEGPAGVEQLREPLPPAQSNWPVYRLARELVVIFDGKKTCFPKGAEVPAAAGRPERSFRPGSLAEGYIDLWLDGRRVAVRRNAVERIRKEVAA